MEEKKKAHSSHHEMQAERLRLTGKLKHWPWQLPVGLRPRPSSLDPWLAFSHTLICSCFPPHLGCLTPEGLHAKWGPALFSHPARCCHLLVLRSPNWRKHIKVPRMRPSIRFLVGLFNTCWPSPTPNPATQCSAQPAPPHYISLLDSDPARPRQNHRLSGASGLIIERWYDIMAKSMRGEPGLPRWESPSHHLLTVLQLLHTNKDNSTYLIELLQIRNVNCLE